MKQNGYDSITDKEEQALDLQPNLVKVPTESKVLNLKNRF